MTSAEIAGSARSRWLAALAYLLMLALGVGLFFLVRWIGEGLTAPEPPDHAPPAPGVSHGSVNVVMHVLATLVAVISLGHVFGRLCRLVGQPPVIGEVLAGIALGPSLLGFFWPQAMHLLIPSADADPNGQVTAALKMIAQLGVILYMFLVGLELNAAKLRKQAHTAVATSHASIVAPFVLGSILALWLYPVLSHRGVPFTSFALFMGVAMSITAFPVLARILTDRGMQSSELGTLALGCAAADDVTAWCLLALVVGVAQAHIGGALAVSAAALAFIAIMFLVIRPLVQNWCQKLDAHDGPLPLSAVANGFVAVLLASLTTEAIGVHAVFGAFLLGAVIPHESRLAEHFIEKLRDPVTILLLPAFFAYTGMRTEIGLVSGWHNWLLCGAIILVATAGKFGGTLIAARLTGQSWRMAAALGVLMNTRGMMLLIVLNIGLDLGVISPTLFAMLVVTALVTTLATAPALSILMRPSH
jgi:Kef-type K+ transport system membrane component KefB